MALVEQSIGRGAVPTHGEPATSTRGIKDAPQALEPDAACLASLDAMHVITRHAREAGQRSLAHVEAAPQEDQGPTKPLVVGVVVHGLIIGRADWPAII
jgi:hypothetical protein